MPEESLIAIVENMCFRPRVFCVSGNAIVAWLRLCVKCSICVPLVRFLSRDDGACDGHTTENEGGCRFARCGTCKRLPSEGTCDCQHTCECFACWEYKDNINRAAMSQGCHYGICGICFKDNSNYQVQCCICKWLCGCENCVPSRNDSNQGCHLADCSTCGGNPNHLCDCEHTCGCHDCRGERKKYQSGVLSGEIIPPEYEQNQGCKFSSCGVCNSAAEESDEGETDKGDSDWRVDWLCKCRYCRHSRSESLQGVLRASILRAALYAAARTAPGRDSSEYTQTSF